MVYFLEQYDQDYVETLDIYKVDSSLNTNLIDGIYEDSDYLKGQFITLDGKKAVPMPDVTKVYEYRNDEVLAKLYDVKRWLEKYIVGINSYISDITAEGVVFFKYKTQGYATEHTLEDFHTESYYTPNYLAVSPFIESSANITCTLNEFSSMRIEDLGDVTFSKFIRSDLNDSSLREISNDLIDTSSCYYVDSSNMYIGNPI